METTGYKLGKSKDGTESYNQIACADCGGTTTRKLARSSLTSTPDRCAPLCRHSDDVCLYVRVQSSCRACCNRHDVHVRQLDRSLLMRLHLLLLVASC
jgi:hypothetical protein